MTGITHRVSLSEWSPKIPVTDAVDPVIIRLCTAPELKHAWEKLYLWWGEVEEPDSKHADGTLGRDSFGSFNYIWIKTIARLCNEETLGSTVITTSQKKKYAAKVEKYAKQLRSSLKGLGAPTALSYYLRHEQPLDDWRKQLESYMIQGLGGEEELREYCYRWMTSQQTEDDEEFNQLTRLWIWQETLAPSGPTIDDVLNRIVSTDWANMPEPIVKKAKSGNERRLLAIRLFARFLHSSLKRNPRVQDERKIIALFAGAILDDSEIGEDTVKDALKDYQL